MRSADLYIKALSANDNLLFADAELASVSLNNISSEKRYSAGLVAVTDLYDSRARLSTSIAKRADAADSLDDALRAIEEVAGQLPTVLARLRKETPLVSPDPADEEVWVSRSLEQNPVLLAKSYAVEVAGQEIDRQKSAHYPTVELAYRFNNRDTEGSLFGGGSEVETSEALVTMKLPLYQGGYVSSRTREAKALHKAAKEDLQKEERAIERQVRSSYQGVFGSIKRVTALAAALEAQEMTLQAKKKGFNAGLLTSLAVLDAERDLFYIKTDYATARYDYLLNTLLLKQGAGILREADVEAINAWLM
jgi:outer membrane protein